MSSVRYEKFLSQEKAARASMLKSRFADLISKAQQTLAVKGKVPDDDLDQVGVQRESKRRQEALEIPREAGHNEFLKIKKRRKPNVQREDEDDHRYYVKKRYCQEIRVEREAYHMVKKKRSPCVRKTRTEKEGDDHDLKRRQEIERQREAARIAIDNMKPTFDMDNLSVMVEFERLLTKKERSHDIKIIIEEEERDGPELKSRQEIQRQREAARMAIDNMKPTFDLDNIGVMAEFERLLTKKERSQDLKIIIEDEERDPELERRQEIERQREAAWIAINNMEKTDDFDNLSAMIELERLMFC